MATVSSGRASATPSQANIDTSYTHPFTCNTCQVAFRNSELQRGHMHGDWHRYNLKRRVASLPPLSSETFAEKVSTAQSSSTEAAARASFERSCQACQKTYYSENAYQNHVGSQKHKTKLAAMRLAPAPSVDGTETASVLSSTFSLGEPIEDALAVGEHDSEVAEEFSKVVDGIKKTSLNDQGSVHARPTRPHHPVPANDRPAHPLSPEKTPSSTPSATPVVEAPLLTCLFCNYKSPTLPLNISHMSKIHGMFVPEQSYLADLSGLIGYLHEKISTVHECLYCGKWKGSKTGIQTHMRDKGHCMIAFESEDEMVEVGQFYDFSSTYSDPEDEDEEEEQTQEKKKKASLRAKLGAKRGIDGGETNRDEDGEGWETDSSESSLDSAELTAVPLDHTHQYHRLQHHAHHSHHDARPHHNRDGWHSHAHHYSHAVYHSEYELHLPSGRSVGHRSLAKYFRQNLHNHPSPSEREARRAITDRAGSGSDDDESAPRNGRGRQGQMVTRANGGTGMLGVTEAKKKEVQVAEKRERKREQRAQTRYQWGVDKRGNSQKHFRDPLLQ